MSRLMAVIAEFDYKYVSNLFTSDKISTNKVKKKNKIKMNNYIKPLVVMFEIGFEVVGFFSLPELKEGHKKMK